MLLLHRPIWKSFCLKVLNTKIRIKSPEDCHKRCKFSHDGVTENKTIQKVSTRMAAMLSLGQTTGCKFVSFTGTWIYRTLYSFFLRQKDIRKWTPNTATYKDKTISYFMSCGRLICRQFIFWLKIQEIVQIMFFFSQQWADCKPGPIWGPCKDWWKV